MSIGKREWVSSYVPGLGSPYAPFGLLYIMFVYPVEIMLIRRRHVVAVEVND